MARQRSRKRAKNRGSGGQFQRRESPVADAADSPPPEDCADSPMEVDEEPPEDCDEDWNDDNAGAASGSDQAMLSFGSAFRCAMSAAARTAHSVCPEVAPHSNAAQPHRSTIARRRKAALNAAKPGMAQAMAAFLRRGAQQQAQQASLPRSSQREEAAQVGVVDQDSNSSSCPAPAAVAPAPVESVEAHSDGHSSESDIAAATATS